MKFPEKKEINVLEKENYTQQESSLEAPSSKTDPPKKSNRLALSDPGCRERVWEGLRPKAGCGLWLDLGSGAVRECVTAVYEDTIQ